jgi:hypothetical protein
MSKKCPALQIALINSIKRGLEEAEKFSVVEITGESGF